MTDKQDVIVSLLKEIDKNVENLGVGGGNTPTSISGGYPIEKVHVSFTETEDTMLPPVITLQPNKFYQITGPVFGMMFSSEAEFYNQSGDFAVYHAEVDNEQLQDMIQVLLVGGLLVEDKSIEGYSYKWTATAQGAEVSAYFSANPNENSTCTVYVPDIYYDGEINVPSFTTELHNITRLNNQGFIYSVNIFGIILKSWFIQVESTIEGKYMYQPTNPMLMEFGAVFTDVPIEEATKVYLNDEAAEILGSSEIAISKIPSYKEITETCEYVFQVVTPCNFQVADLILHWNNDTAPDFEQPGILTVSVVGGHAVYTFKPM